MTTTAPLAQFITDTQHGTGDAIIGGFAARKRYRVGRVYLGPNEGITHVYWPARVGHSFDAIAAALMALTDCGITLSQFRSRGTWGLLDAEALITAGATVPTEHDLATSHLQAMHAYANQGRTADAVAAAISAEREGMTRKAILAEASQYKGLQGAIRRARREARAAAKA